MKDFSISMALVDFIPVIFFGISSIILMRDLYNKMSKAAYAIFCAGMVNITFAGALKALYKLLYALGICDFEALSDMFFPTQSIGFLLAGIGIVLMMCQKSGSVKMLGTAPVFFSGTFVFVGLMVAGLGLMDTVLCILSAKLKKPWLIAIFAVSFVCSLGMGYLSSKNFEVASMNWIAQGVNVAGQGSLLLGVYFLDKNGLKDLVLRGGEK